jgi:glycogen synthase
MKIIAQATESDAPRALPPLLKQILQSATFIAPRWETEFTPCAGVTAVGRQERKAFAKFGVVIAPWEPLMVEAQAALASGRVRETQAEFAVEVAYGITARVRILLAEEGDREPIIYLAVAGFFQGKESPYDTTSLKEDTVVFALAVAELLKQASLRPQQWIWCVDWETVPAMILLKKRHHVALHIHNILDTYLGHTVQHFAFPDRRFLEHASVLKAGLREADVVAGVNQGFVWSLQNELIYTQVMAAHLQNELRAAVPVMNASFVSLTPELAQVQTEMELKLSDGFKTLQALKEEARRRLPREIQERIRGKALAVAMGRRSPQKLHEVAVSSARILLHRTQNAPVFWLFATVPGDAGSDARLEMIRKFCADVPTHAAYTDKSIPFFNDLLMAADFNLMPSLYEPHGGCFQAAAVPVVRAIDGLAAQVPGYLPTGVAAALSQRWHQGVPAAGWTVREEPQQSAEQAATDIRQILSNDTPADNLTIQELSSRFADVLNHALNVRERQPEIFAAIVRETLRSQKQRSWEINYGGMFSHIAAAQLRRPLAW